MKRAVKRSKTKKENLLKDFFLGVIIFVVIEVIFMVGGLLIEQSQGKLITGVPSAIGLTLAVIISLFFLFKGREYVFMGSSLLAFVPPVILFVLSFFAPDSVILPTINYSLGYITIVVIILYIYLFFKLVRGKK